MMQGSNKMLLKNNKLKKTSTVPVPLVSFVLPLWLSSESKEGVVLLYIFCVLKLKSTHEAESYFVCVCVCARLYVEYLLEWAAYTLVQL